MFVRWQVFKSGDIRTEAQLFSDEGGRNRKAVLFCPGFPGAGATLFEQRHAGAFVEAGYDVIVLKHKGIRLDSPAGPHMVNNSARFARGRAGNETHIGGGPATIDEWLTEPLAVLTTPMDYESLHVIGNSFGALSALWSLTTERVALPAVKSLLLLAGAQGLADGGPDGIMRIWKPEYLTVPRITDRVALNGVEDIVATLRGVYADLPLRVKTRLSDHIALTYLVVAGDELLRLEDTLGFQAAIGGRGHIVMDTVDRAWPDYGLMAHDTPDYPTGALLNLLEGTSS